MAARGGNGTYSLLRSSDEPSRPQAVLVPGGLALASCAVAAQPEGPRALGPNDAAHQALAARPAHLSSLSPQAPWRCYLRQEPDAAIPAVRIRGGGYGQP